MKKNRYINKNYLCKYDLTSEFFNEMEIKIKDVIPLRKVFMLVTDDGNKILKKIDYDIEKLNIINDSLKYIKKKYSNVITFNQFKDNKPYKIWNDDKYVIMDAIDGRECSYYNPVEIQSCAKNIALMHNASLGLREYLEEKYKKNMIDISLIDKFETAYKETAEIKKRVESYKYKNEFDETFIKYADKYLDEIKESGENIKNSSYEELRNNNNIVTLCHNDLAYHNFLINDDKISIIDFDYMTIDIRVMDIADFLLKLIKNAAFDVNKMISGLQAYEKVNKILPEEKQILKILLKFPRDFYSIVTDYYYKNKDWDYEIFLSRLRNKVENEKFRYEFLDVFEEKILK